MNCEDESRLVEKTIAYCSLGTVKFTHDQQLEINGVKWKIEKIIVYPFESYSTPTLSLSYVEGGKFSNTDIDYFRKSELLVPADNIALSIRRNQLGTNCPQTE